MLEPDPGLLLVVVAAVPPGALHAATRSVIPAAAIATRYLKSIQTSECAKTPR
jgi:hypothetical protein